MAKFTGMHYSGQSLIIDGNVYKECSFYECELVYKGGVSSPFIACVVSNSNLKFKETITRVNDVEDVLNAIEAAKEISE